jgi:hypothetical protein
MIIAAGGFCLALGGGVLLRIAKTSPRRRELARYMIFARLTFRVKGNGIRAEEAHWPQGYSITSSGNN